MDTKFWGPGGWRFLHTITFNYPENPTAADKRNYKSLFLNFQFTLPCKYCRESYAKFLRELPIEPYLASRSKLTMWLYLIHNKVNDKLRNQGNPTPPNPSYAYVAGEYEKQRANCSKEKKTCSKSNSGLSGAPLSLADRMTFLI